MCREPGLLKLQFAPYKKEVHRVVWAKFQGNNINSRSLITWNHVSTRPLTSAQHTIIMPLNIISLSFSSTFRPFELFSHKLTRMLRKRNLCTHWHLPICNPFVVFDIPFDTNRNIDWYFICNTRT